MTWTHHRLLPALAVSLLLHALPLLFGFMPQRQAPSPPPRLEATLRLPPPALDQPPLMLPEAPNPAPPAKQRQPKPQPPRLEKPRPAKPPEARTEWTAAVREQFRERDRRGDFYPGEAIARGLEGEAVVLLVLDEAGNAVAARIEESSGHAILDQAALRAVRSLRSLPAAAPRETLVPVRFRLR